MNENKKTFYDACKNDKILRKLLQDELKGENILHIIDVGEDRFFMTGVDIDLLIVNKEYKINSVEVKADNYGTTAGIKKIFLETVSNDNKFSATGGREGLGCAMYSKSDFFLYYFIKLHSYLIIPTRQLQAWITVNLPKGKFEIKTSKTYGYNEQLLYSSYGMLVPINTLIEECGAKLYEAHCDWNDYAGNAA